jgi:hypothetical protein
LFGHQWINEQKRCDLTIPKQALFSRIKTNPFCSTGHFDGSNYETSNRNIDRQYFGHRL